MITFIIILAVSLLLAIIPTLVLMAIGAGLIAVFGDLIIFGLIVWLIIRILMRKK